MFFVCWTITQLYRIKTKSLSGVLRGCGIQLVCAQEDNNSLLLYNTTISQETPTMIPTRPQCGAHQCVHFISRPDSLTTTYSGTITGIKTHPSQLIKSNILHKLNNAYLGQSTCHVIITYYVMDGRAFLVARKHFMVETVILWHCENKQMIKYSSIYLNSTISTDIYSQEF